MSKFVPVADEVHRLQTGKDPECRLFQKIAEKGHYAGRTRPTKTRQGIYAAAPSGHFLASINSNDPMRVKAMLERALVAWKELPEADRYLEKPLSDRSREIWRADERKRPEDGLVLRVYSRDVDRGENPTKDWRGQAWNLDIAWLRAEDVRGFLPSETLDAGSSVEVPQYLLVRLARCHLVDNVRGQTPPYAHADIRSIRLTSTVESASMETVTLGLEGAFEIEKEGNWSIDGHRDLHRPSEQRRGYTGRLVGRATYDRASSRMTAFEMVALGTRYGATQYNGRQDDPSGPMAIAFTLAGEDTADQVAPALIWAYGW